MPTITQQEYKQLLNRQTEVERELQVVKVILRNTLREEMIRPSVLKKWERISRDLDRGRGRTFTSLSRMDQWLKNA